MTTRTLIVCDGCDAEVEEVEAKDEWCLGLTLTTSGGGKRNTLKETIGTFDLCQVCTQKMANNFNPKAWERKVTLVRQTENPIKNADHR